MASQYLGKFSDIPNFNQFRNLRLLKFRSYFSVQVLLLANTFLVPIHGSIIAIQKYELEGAWKHYLFMNNTKFSFKGPAGLAAQPIDLHVGEREGPAWYSGTAA